MFRQSSQVRKLGTRKERFKLYKAGKLWITAGMATMVLGISALKEPTTVHADATADATAGQQPLQAAAVPLKSPTEKTAQSRASTAAAGTVTQQGQQGDTQATAVSAPIQTAAPEQETSQMSQKVAPQQPDVTARKLATPPTKSGDEDGSPSISLTTGKQTVTYTVTYPDETTTSEPNVTNDRVRGNAFQAAFSLKSGDVATIFVPDDLIGLKGDEHAQALNAQVSDATQNGLSGKLYTFTATEDSVVGPSFTFDQISNRFSNLREAQTVKLPVTLSINGKQVAELDYQVVIEVKHLNNQENQQTITAESKVRSLFYDVNQNKLNDLVIGQPYAFGLGRILENHSLPLYLAQGEEVKTTGTITVPTGFVLDGSEIVTADKDFVGGSMKSISGDVNVPVTDQHLLKQNGNTLSLSSLELPVNEIYTQLKTLMFWGHYTQPLTADDNIFTTALTFAPKQADKKQVVTSPDGSTTTTTLIVQLTPATDPTTVGLNVAQTAVAASELGLSTTKYDVNGETIPAIYRDGMDRNQILASTDSAVKPHNNGRFVVGYLNSGNTAQTNATFTIDYHGIKSTFLTATAGDFAKLSGITVTYTDGTTATDAGSLGHVTLDPTKGVQQAVLKYATIPAGQKLDLELATDGWSDTTQATGTTLPYTASFQSEQTPTAVTKTIPVTVLDYAYKDYMVTVNSNTGINGNGGQFHIGNSFDQGITLHPETPGPLGNYVLTVSNNLALDLDKSTVDLTPEDGPATTVPLKQYATLIGPVGEAGEMVYDIAFPTDSFKTAGVHLSITVKQDALPGQMNVVDWFVQEDNSIYTDPQVVPLRHDVTIAGHDIKISGTASPMTPIIFIPSQFGNRNGIDDRMTPDVTYLSYDPSQPTTTTAHFVKQLSGNTDSGQDTSTMRLVTINSFNVASPWTQNVVVLPRKSEGAAFDLELTGPGSITSDSTDTGQLMYSETVPDTAGGKMDLTGFKSAGDVTDWEKIRSVVLTTGELGANTAVAAILPIKVADIDAAADEATVTFDSTFKGVDRAGQVATNVQTMAASVIARQTVTVKYVKDDGETLTDIIHPQTTDYEVGDHYTTNPLAAALIPDGYELREKPENASGDVGDSPITVTYVYAKPGTPPTTTKATETKTVSEIINYKYNSEDGAEAHAPHNDSVTFTRDVTKNSAGEVISTTPWAAANDDTTFDAFKSPEIPGYLPDVAEVPAVTGITADTADIQKTVIYKQAAGQTPEISTAVLHVLLQDTKGEELGKDTLNSAIGNTYTYSAPELSGYTYRVGKYPDGKLTTENSLTGTLLKADQTIVLTYSQDIGKLPEIDKAVLHFRLQDTQGKLLGSDDLDSEIGNGYSYTAPALTGYTYRVGKYPNGSLTTKETMTGTLQAAEQTIVLTYSLDTGKLPNVDKAVLHVRLQNTQGKVLGSDDLNSEIGNGYSYTAPELSGYTYRVGKYPDGSLTTKDTLTGTLETAEQTIVLTYSQEVGKVPDVTSAVLNIRLQDEAGKLLGSDKLTGAVGNDYSYLAPDLAGYTYRDALLPDGTVTAATTLAGRLTAPEQTLILTYKQQVGQVPDEQAAVLNIRLQDEQGRLLGRDSLKTAIGNRYSYVAPALAGFTYRDAVLPAGTVTTEKILTGQTKLAIEYLVLTYVADKPSQPDQPGKPTGPTDPNQPTTPTRPTEPNQPGEPTRPTEPDQPGKPTGPTEPNQPTTPTQLTEPSQPTTPTQPTEPSQPTTPSQPTGTPLSPQPDSAVTPLAKPATKPQSQLPKTGDSVARAAAVAGVMLLALIGGAATLIRKNRI